MRKLSMAELDRKSVKEFKISGKIPIVAVLENIRSMHNVGSIFRTADAFLLEHIYLCGYTPQPPHRDINKTALGATETVDWKYFQQITPALNQLKKDGYNIYAVEQTAESDALNALPEGFPEKLAIIFGNEVDGVSQEALEYCDGSLEIPQFGMKHSLNVSVAAGIVLWELIRDRKFSLNSDIKTEK